MIHTDGIPTIANGAELFEVVAEGSYDASTDRLDLAGERIAQDTERALAKLGPEAEEILLDHQALEAATGNKPIVGSHNVRVLDVLKNGATVVAIGTGDHDWRLVFCATTDHLPNGTREYVSWWLDRDGDAHHGDYWQAAELFEAVAAFHVRCGR